jgi:hypothetical protein
LNDADRPKLCYRIQLTHPDGEGEHRYCEYQAYENKNERGILEETLQAVKGASLDSKEMTMLR